MASDAEEEERETEWRRSRGRRRRRKRKEKSNIQSRTVNKSSVLSGRDTREALEGHSSREKHTLASREGQHTLHTTPEAAQHNNATLSPSAAPWVGGCLAARHTGVINKRRGCLSEMNSGGRLSCRET